MASFRVGQRVRVVKAVGLCSRLLGQETTVTDIRAAATCDLCGASPMYVLACGAQLNDAWTTYEVLGCSCSIEPIREQPERNRVVAWEDLDLPFDPRNILEAA